MTDYTFEKYRNTHRLLSSIRVGAVIKFPKEITFNNNDESCVDMVLHVDSETYTQYVKITSVRGFSILLCDYDIDAFDLIVSKL